MPSLTGYVIHAGIGFLLHQCTAAPQTYLKILHNDLAPIN